jgi:hypothetical protein
MHNLIDNSHYGTAKNDGDSALYKDNNPSGRMTYSFSSSLAAAVKECFRYTIPVAGGRAQHYPAGA